MNDSTVIAINTLSDEQGTSKGRVRYWKKVILRQLARQLSPDGELFIESRIYGDGNIDAETDQASFEEAAYELRRELDRRTK